MWLGVTAGIYLGFTLQDGRSSAFGVEVLGLALFAAVASVALAGRTPWLLAAGYVGHSVGDLVHHRRGIDTAMPWWWVPVCRSAWATTWCWPPTSSSACSST